jgi:hypothetical protein
LKTNIFSTRSGWSLGILLAATTLLTSCNHLQHTQWPAIRQVSVCHHFAANRDSEQLKAMIYGKDGKPLYCIDARFCWRDSQDERGQCSPGALDCRLYPLSGLAPTSSKAADWPTCGRFTEAELAGLAGADASRSISRRCAVRGMSITIQVLNIVREYDGRGVASLDMVFTASNDPAANADIAEQRAAL